jgi:hypothetical protein
MNRFAAIVAFLAALSMGWVPVLAAPGGLAAAILPHNAVAAEALPAPISIHHASACAGKKHHCPGGTKQQHPVVCAACIGVPAVTLLTLVIEQSKLVIPRGDALPLVAQASKPLPRPPRL